MLHLRGTAFLTVLLVLGSVATAEETSPSDAAKFLQENGLEDYQVMCVDFISAIVAGKPGTANEIVVNSMYPAVTEKFRDLYRDALIKACSGTHDCEITDAELAGYQKFSSKAIELSYVLNTNYGPIHVTISAYRYQDTWYTKGWYFATDMSKIREQMRGTVQFSKSIVVPLKRDEKKS